MIDINKPVYWNGTRILQEKRPFGDGWYAPAENGGPIKDFFEIKWIDSATTATYEYIYLDLDDVEENYGWSGYEPLPLSNVPPAPYLSNLVFASIKSGHYIILKDDVVVGTIRRQMVQDFRHSMWAFNEYHLHWKDGSEVEKFKRLWEIHEKHKFMNYGGYMDVLRKK
jgi:hypothetical protein